MRDPLTQQASNQIPRITLKRRDIAKALSVSECSVDRLMADENLPHFRCGAMLFFPVSEVTAWAARKAAEQAGVTQ